MRAFTSLLSAVALLIAGTGHTFPASAQDAPTASLAARDAEPVVLTGSDLPAWSRLAAVGEPTTWPEGALTGERDAHAGTLHVPPDVREGVPVDEVVAYRYEAGEWMEIPVQVDERFPHFLSNPDSDFGIYSAVDEELTYEWDVESWKKTAGECFAEYPEGVGVTEDPVGTLDDDDEIAFMASDAGELAPSGALGPPKTGETRQEIALVDPLDPASVGYVYLFRSGEGPSFDEGDGYVSYERDPDADEWIDRYSIARDDPETLGVSNTGYGPNLSGTVCRTADFPGYPDVADGTPRDSSDRFPRDGVTVRTDAYEWRATGRWMVRGMSVAKPGEPGVYGPDLIDRWKGRAFQQSPDSSISLVGFEDEQVNWEANAALIGERTGPVRAIREVWGADSGTNTTKTETFYRDAVTYRYHLRVHPIPPDGIYTSWDYNAGVASKYFNVLHPEGVDIDGRNDDVGNVDDVAGFPAFFDAPDPTLAVPLSVDNWEQVSGTGDAGSLVYLYELLGPTSLENPLIFPYYRDDACFDDGTGDDPVARPWPGEDSDDPRVRDGYAAEAGMPYEELACEDKQGAWGSHGVHVFLSGDTDNAFQSKPLTEVDARQWQFAVPTESPEAVGQPYADTVIAPLRPVAVEQANTPAKVDTRISLEASPWDGRTKTTEVDVRLVEDEDGDPLEGRTVELTVDGAVEAVLSTGSDGSASTVLHLPPPPQRDLGASYAGDEETEPVAVTARFRPGSGASGQSSSGA